VAASGCCWLQVAAAGCKWLLLAAIGCSEQVAASGYFSGGRWSAAGGQGVDETRRML